MLRTEWGHHLLARQALSMYVYILGKGEEDHSKDEVRQHQRQY